jgi:hypothetical protein
MRRLTQSFSSDIGTSLPFKQLPIANAFRNHLRAFSHSVMSVLITTRKYGGLAHQSSSLGVSG